MKNFFRKFPWSKTIFCSFIASAVFLVSDLEMHSMIRYFFEKTALITLIPFIIVLIRWWILLEIWSLKWDFKITMASLRPFAMHNNFLKDFLKINVKKDDKKDKSEDEL